MRKKKPVKRAYKRRKAIEATEVRRNPYESMKDYEARKEALKLGEEIHSVLLDGKKPVSDYAKEYAKSFWKQSEIQVSMSKEDAESFRDRFADLLCWWRGFRVAFKIQGETSSDLDYAENGIRAMSDMRDIIERQISTATKYPPA